MKSAIIKVAHDCLEMILQDGPWEDIGYHGRPKYGRLIQRFRPKWKVALELSILREMLAVFSAVHVAAGRLAHSDIASLVELYIDGSEGSLWQTFGFCSRDEARRELRESILLYTETEATKWPYLLAQRLHAFGISDGRMAARLLLGITRFADSSAQMLTRARRADGVSG